jgi:hypothetical protein
MRRRTTGGEHAQPVTVLEVEAEVLRRQLLPKPPNAEVLRTLRGVVEQDHGGFAQLRPPRLPVVTHRFIRVQPVDVQEIDLRRFKRSGGGIKIALHKR